MDGQWLVQAGVVHCALSGHAWGPTPELAVCWVASSCSQLRMFAPCFWDFPPAASRSTVSAAGNLPPSSPSVFSFSPFLVKESSRGDCKVQDRWHQEGKERESEFQQQQEQDVNRNDGFSPAVLLQKTSACHSITDVLILG